MRSIRTALAAGLLCLSAPVGPGQVRQVQNGQVLDANPQVGRGGYNAPVPGGQPVDAQLYVTGQVSGLGAFRGRVGYYSGNQLHLDLPSARLGDFRRQSVGLADVLGGQSYITAPYYERTTTAFKVQDMLAGRAAAGTNIPATALPSTSSLAQELYVNALTFSGPLDSTMDGGSTLRGGPGVGRTRPYAAGGTGPYVGAAAIGPWSPAGAGTGPLVPALPAGREVFQLARRQDQAQLAMELYIAAHRAGMVDAHIGAPPDVPAGPAGKPDPLIRPAEKGAITPVGAALGRPAPNRDAFLDLLWQIEQVRSRRRLQTAGALDANALAASAYDSRLVRQGPDGTIVIRGLAGESRDLFNVTMTRAEQKLRAGRYYDAAELYETASLVDVRNPLARIGMGLSLLQAGETLTAASQIERAVGLFPPLIQLRVDLANIVGEKALEMQARQIENRIRRADPAARKKLQFLAMFLYYNSGREEKARSYAEKVRELVGPGNTIRAYAETILRRSGAGKPPEGPTEKQPAPAGGQPRRP